MRFGVRRCYRPGPKMPASCAKWRNGIFDYLFSAFDISHTASGGIWKSMLPAGIGYMAGCWWVIMLVGSRGRVGLVIPIPNGHLPALFGGPFHVQLGSVSLSVG
jgi:hypothetical protein